MISYVCVCVAIKQLNYLRSLGLMRSSRAGVNIHLLLTCSSLPASDLLLLFPQLCLHLRPLKLRLFVDQLIQQLKQFRMNECKGDSGRVVQPQPEDTAEVLAAVWDTGGKQLGSRARRPVLVPSCCRFSRHPAPSVKTKCFCPCQGT